MENMLFGTTETMDSGQWVKSIKRVQTGVFSETMMMTSVPISRGITGSTGYQPLVNGLMLTVVCPFGKRLKEDFFFIYCIIISLFSVICASFKYIAENKK